MPIRKNTAHNIPFILLNSLTGGVLTGATVTGYKSLDGGEQEAVVGDINEIAGGQYLFEGSAEDFNSDYSTGLLFTASSAIPVHLLLQSTYFRKDTAYDIPFLLINASSSGGLTGANPSAVRCLDGGGQESVDGTFEELGHGQYVFHAAATDFGADDIAGFLITATNAVPIHLTIDLLESYTTTSVTDDSPATIIANYLTGLAVMTVPSAEDDWPLYISNLPDSPDNAAVIFNTTPIKDAKLMDDGSIIQHYGIEILLRSIIDEDGWDKCNILSGELDILRNVFVSINDSTYKIHNVTRLGGINSLGSESDSRRRNLFSMNFTVSITKI